MIIGVLALQGDFDAHRRRLEELGAEVVLVRNAEQFDQIDGLVIPGGESSTFLKLLGRGNFPKAERLRPHQADIRHLRRSDHAGQRSGESASARPECHRHDDSPQRLRPPDRFHHRRSCQRLWAASRWRWFSFALRASKKLAQAWKYWPSATMIPCWCGRER